jgi:hypothetical protein
MTFMISTPYEFFVFAAASSEHGPRENPEDRNGRRDRAVARRPTADREKNAVFWPKPGNGLLDPALLDVRFKTGDEKVDGP